MFVCLTEDTEVDVSQMSKMETGIHMKNMKVKKNRSENERGVRGVERCREAGKG